MKNCDCFSVIGGDIRQIYIANQLAEEGCKVLSLGFDDTHHFHPSVRHAHTVQEAVAESGCVILPMPLSDDSKTIWTPLSQKTFSLAEVFAGATPSKLLFGGKISPRLLEEAEGRGLKLFDYLCREEMAVLNAVPTAEGALQIAMEQTKHTIFGSRCLVCGYGRIGKVLADMLKALGAKVTVSARKYSDFAWITTRGHTPMKSDDIKTRAGRFDLIFNTVPHLLFPESVLRILKTDVCLIDLASKPGGVDFYAAEQLDVNCIWALSLPGKVAPRTAGDVILGAIKNMIEEENM